MDMQPITREQKQKQASRDPQKPILNHVSKLLSDR